MFSCSLPCAKSHHSEINKHLNIGASNGPTSFHTQLLRNTPHQAKIRSLLGALLPPQIYNNPTTPFSIDQPDHPDTLNVESKDMRCESNRIKTFEKWPVSFLPAEQVARNGFYYLGQGDVVRCAFCDVKILKWVEGDDPAIEHRRWEPHCPFVRKFMNSKNVTGRDECGLHIPAFTTPRIVGPAHPCYSTKAARLRSFQSWPRCMRQKPEDLAEAGLFYTGQGDKTKCFYCDGGLKDWEDDDVAWEQHARWFDKCPYVQLMKGLDFIQKVKSTICSTPVSNEEKDLSLEKSRSSNPSDAVEKAVDSEQSESNDPSEMVEKPVDKSKICIICCGNDRNVCFVPCGHVVACAKCALTVDKCPMCRSTFQSAVRLYFS